MSDSTEFSLLVLDKYHLANFYGLGLAESLANGPAPLDPQNSCRFEASLRQLRGQSRGSWFQEAVKELLSRSGIQGLGFLSAQTHNHLHIAIDPLDEIYPREFRTQHQYTVIRDDHAVIADTIQNLIDWCESHPEEADEILVMDYPESTTDSLCQSFFTLHPNRDLVMGGGDEGSGSLFTLCTLRTTRDLLKYAAHQHFWAIYDNARAV